MESVMSNEMVRVLNTANGQVQEVPAKLMNDPHFREFHVEVGHDVSSFTPGLFTPKTAVEYERMHLRVQEPAVDRVATDQTPVTYNEQETE